ncbi:MAG: hypothetical protein H0W72_08860, partial [Planctomycetes bacterium]|nr:hypothetical protein [Planctomycetota bacterium]
MPDTSMRADWSVAAILLLAAFAPITAGAETPLERTLALPVSDGRIRLGDLLGAVVDRFGGDGGQLRRDVPGTIDIDGAAGAVQAWVIAQASEGAVRVRRDGDQLIVAFDRLRQRRGERRLRSAMRELVGRLAPGQAATMAARTGLWVHDGGATKPAATVDLPERAVILVHGLDEPGDCWSQVAPALTAVGHRVVEFRYANDQPIATSIAELGAALVDARRRGLSRICLVGHSMGGLVCRGLLAGSGWYADDGSGSERLPDVGQLVLVAVPNHGSSLARWQLASEVRDQLARTLSGDGLLFGAVLDGAGEAAIDLAPGSEFLTELASHPLPRGVTVSTIAGDRSPVSAATAHQAAVWAAARLPDIAGLLTGLEGDLAAVATGLGDGAVALESARLD